MYQRLNWNPTNDQYLKPKEIAIHHTYHEAQAKEITDRDSVFGPRQARIDALESALAKTGQSLSGQVLEVGAGDGWCSAYMHLHHSPEHIFTMEINEPAIESLIPKVFEVTGVDEDRATLVLGSFNKIPMENHFDFVVAMGSLHHSANLFATYKNVYRCLKPGGWLLAQEPYMVNSTPNSYYSSREKETIQFKGMLDVRNSDRTDIFYRECEYRSAAFHAGFDFDCQTIFNREKFLRYFSRQVPESIDRPNNLVLFAQKPRDASEERPATSWETESLHNRHVA